MSKMSVIIRLQGLSWTASAGDIRSFFQGLNIPDGGVHIVGGERGDAFIAFTSDEDARLAMQHNNGFLKDSQVQLFLSSKTEMQNVIAEARDGHAPAPLSNMPPPPSHQNIPPMGGAPLDNFARNDHGDRGMHPTNVPHFSSHGPTEDFYHPANNGPHSQRDHQMPPRSGMGRLDDQRGLPPDSFLMDPRGGRDVRQPPNMFPPWQTGQDERPEFSSSGPRGRNMDRSDIPSSGPRGRDQDSAEFPPFGPRGRGMERSDFPPGGPRGRDAEFPPTGQQGRTMEKPEYPSGGLRGRDTEFLPGGPRGRDTEFPPGGLRGRDTEFPPMGPRGRDTEFPPMGPRGRDTDRPEFPRGRDISRPNFPSDGPRGRDMERPDHIPPGAMDRDMESTDFHRDGERGRATGPRGRDFNRPEYPHPSQRQDMERHELSPSASRRRDMERQEFPPSGPRGRDVDRHGYPLHATGPMEIDAERNEFPPPGPRMRDSNRPDFPPAGERGREIDRPEFSMPDPLGREMRRPEFPVPGQRGRDMEIPEFLAPGPAGPIGREMIPQEFHPGRDVDFHSPGHRDNRYPPEIIPPAEISMDRDSSRGSKDSPGFVDPSKPGDRPGRQPGLPSYRDQRTRPDVPSAGSREARDESRRSSDRRSDRTTRDDHRSREDLRRDDHRRDDHRRDDRRRSTDRSERSDRHDRQNRPSDRTSRDNQDAGPRGMRDNRPAQQSDSVETPPKGRFVPEAMAGVPHDIQMEAQDDRQGSGAYPSQRDSRRQTPEDVTQRHRHNDVRKPNMPGPVEFEHPSSGPLGRGPNVHQEESHGFRYGQGPPDNIRPGVNNFGDQDTRGPIPRHIQDDRSSSQMTQRPDSAVAGNRGPPSHRAPPSGFPRDQDSRFPGNFGDIQQPRPANYRDRPPVERDPFQEQSYGEPINTPRPMQSVDWDSRHPRDALIPSRPPRGPPNHQEGIIPTPRMHIDEKGNMYKVPNAEGEQDNSYRARSNPRTLLPDPVGPRLETDSSTLSIDERYNRHAEHGGRFPNRESQFDKPVIGDYPERMDTADQMPPQRGPYPPPRERMDISEQKMLPLPMQTESGEYEFYAKVMNMPLNITYSMLRRFFGGILIPRDGIKLLNNSQGNRNGLGYIKLTSRREFNAALASNGRMLETRQVEIIPCSTDEFEAARDSYPTSASVRSLSPKRHIVDDNQPSPKRKKSEDPVDTRTKNRFVIMIRDVAYRATTHDLKQYFDGLEIAENGKAVVPDEDSSGKHNGIAFVEFSNYRDFQLALQRNYGRILGRIVYVSAADPKDMDKVKEKIEKRRKPTEKYTEKPRDSSKAGSGDHQTDRTDKTPLKTPTPVSTQKSAVMQTPPSNSKPSPSTKTTSTSKTPLKPTPTPNSTPGPKSTATTKPAQMTDSSSNKTHIPKTSPALKTNTAPNTTGVTKKEPTPVKASPPVAISCFCVRMKNLPSSLTKKDVEEFFKGLDISPKGYNPVLKKDGTCTGDAFVEFVSPKDCTKAVARDQGKLKDKKVTVQAIPKATMKSELEELTKKALEESQPQGQPQRPPPLYFMLGAQNLPFSVSIGEILNFFRGYNPVPESIRLHYNNEGRATGDAVIGFMTESECHRALRDLNTRMLGRRNVRLYLA